jgi:histidinol phosphatase-like enzyme (inositol monophosphatase family)
MARTAASDFNSLLRCAHELADETGPTVLKYFRRPLKVTNKATGSAFDPVTNADRAAERMIAKVLRTRCPDHGLVGEEFGSRGGSGRFTWIVDPIDGTRAFIMGSPLWGTLIGLLDAGAPCLGVMDQPFTGERFWSGKTASYLRIGDAAPKKIRTRACARLEDAILTSTHPDLFESSRQRKILSDLSAAVRMTRFGGDCYGYCLLASGHVDLIIEPGLKTYDIAPLIPIIERAGGIVSTWDGLPASSGGDVIAAGDARVHEAALRLIAKSKR